MKVSPTSECLLKLSVVRRLNAPPSAVDDVKGRPGHAYLDFRSYRVGWTRWTHYSDVGWWSVASKSSVSGRSTEVTEYDQSPAWVSAHE